MKKTQELLREKGIIPRVDFDDNKEHIFTIINEEVKTIEGNNGPVTGMVYTVRESGEERQFFTAAISALQGLAQLAEGTTVSMTKRRYKNPQGAWRVTYDIKVVDGNISDDDIPVIND